MAACGSLTLRYHQTPQAAAPWTRPARTQARSRTHREVEELATFELRCWRGTTQGAGNASQVVAAPDAHHVRALCGFASTPAAMCANPSSPLEI